MKINVGIPQELLKYIFISKNSARVLNYILHSKYKLQKDKTP